MADIAYDYSKIQEYLNSLEANSSEIASISSDPFVDALKLVDLTNAKTLNVNSRLQAYINTISAYLNINKDFDVTQNAEAAVNALSCAGKNTDFNITNQTVIEGPATNATSDQSAYSVDTKVSQATNVIHSIFFNALGLHEFEAAQLVTPMFEDFESAFETQVLEQAYKYDISCNLHANIMKMTDIKLVLNDFMLNLEKIRKLNVKYVFLKTRVSSGIGWQFSYGGCVFSDDDSKYTGVEDTLYINYLPYVVKIDSNEFNDIYVLPSAYKIESTSITFSNLVKIEDIDSDIDKFDITNYEGLNGTYDQFKVVTMDRFDIFSTIDLETTYNIKKGEVISRNNILKAIDDIFNTWINNIQNINYTVYMCHYNCHGNEYSYTGDPCCFCGKCSYGDDNCNPT